MNESFEESLKGRETEFSSFFAQELMLDFLDGELDQKRAAAIKAKVSTSKDLQKLIKSMESGRSFARALSEIEPSQTLITRLQSHKAGWVLWMDRLSPRRWPEFARWTFEAAMIAVFVAWVMSFIPMEKLKSLVPLGSKDIVLHEVESVLPPGQQTSNAQGEDDGPLTPTDAQAEKDRGSVTGVMAAKPSAPTSTSAQTPEPTSEPTRAKEAAKPKGFLYRGSLNVADLEAGTEGIRLLIESLEGEKAGQVELGWRQDSGGSYFHFSLPESNYEALQDGLRTFGPVRIYRDSHPRVMPRGQVRIILEVKGSAEKQEVSP